MVVDLGVFQLLLYVMGFGAARALAIWVAMTWNFALNRRFTFAAARDGAIAWQYLLFCLSCGLGALVNWSVSTYVWNVWGEVVRYELLAAIPGILAGVALNYLLSSRIVFRPAAKP